MHDYLDKLCLVNILMHFWLCPLISVFICPCCLKVCGWKVSVTFQCTVEVPGLAGLLVTHLRYLHPRKPCDTWFSLAVISDNLDFGQLVGILPLRSSASGASSTGLLNGAPQRGSLTGVGCPALTWTAEHHQILASDQGYTAPCWSWPPAGPPCCWRSPWSAASMLTAPRTCWWTHSSSCSRRRFSGTACLVFIVW